MVVELPGELQSFVRDAVSSGAYESEAAVIDAAVRLLREREEKLAALREEILPAYEAFKRGEYTSLDREEFLAECRTNLASQNESEP